ncbi:D-alanine--D-alanine ligase A [Pseudomonas fluorescens]|nr:D-alanine--D-alanine ligase A [Pseudomonas fluorescens]VVP81011.1 D-alanine--D-alanine ligase A [Pseudomonas fluorescens]
MDKDFTKRLLKEAGISVTPWMAAQAMPAWSSVVQALGHVVFVKPASSGSSIGVSRVTNAEEYTRAFTEASRSDIKVIVEAEVCGREIECGILEVNGELVASELGEIIPLGKHRFYDYKAKYEDEAGARLCVPCCLPAEIKSEMQRLSKQAFECLGLEGLARVDFFLREDGSVVLNEVNTLPGFTSISMYPKMFEFSGYPLKKLVAQLVRSTVSMED